MYKPGDVVYVEFTTQVFATGVGTNADSTPVGTVNKNGTDDGAVTVTVTNIDTARYKAVFTIPATYNVSDVLNLTVAATVSTIAGKACIWHCKLEAGYIAQGTATAGGTNTITLATSIGADSRGVGSLCCIVAGTGAGQAEVISSYVHSTKVVTVGRNWATQPDSTSVYTIIYGDFAAVNSSLIPDVRLGNVTHGGGSATLQLGSSSGSTVTIDCSDSGGADTIKIRQTDAAGGAALRFSTSNATSGFGIAFSSAGAANISAPLGFTGAVASVISPITLPTGEARVVQAGTASAGGASTITIATAIGADSRPKGCTISITGGTGIGQTRGIVTYVNATKVVTVDTPWATNPDNTSVYAIHQGHVPSLDLNLKVNGVVLTDTITTYTGNTPQTGDPFLRIGVAGVGLTNLGDTRIANLDATVGSRSTLTQTQVTGGTYGINSASCVLGDARIANLDGTITSRASNTDMTTMLTRLSSARAGYLDFLNIGGAVASHADITAINQSATRTITLATVAQYERPESGSITYTIEARTYSASTGSPVNADTTPTLTATGSVSGSLSGNLSAATNPSTGVYRWSYTTSSTDTTEQVRMDVSATVATVVYTLSAYTQVTDFVSVTFTAADRTSIQAAQASAAAVQAKLPGGGASIGDATASAVATLQTSATAIQAKTGLMLFDASNFIKSTPQTNVTLADSSLTTAKLGVFVLAKGTNISGLNDIAATAIVSNGAITTSGGKVSGVATVDTVTGGAVDGGAMTLTSGERTATANAVNSVLSTAHGSGAWTGGGGGGLSGSTSVTVEVLDADLDGVPNARITVTPGGSIKASTQGTVSFSLDAGVYTVDVSPQDGSLFETVTILVVDGNPITIQITGTANTIPAPTNPDDCNCYAYLQNPDETPIVGEVIRYSIKKSSGTAGVWINSKKYDSTPSDSNGLVIIPIRKGSSASFSYNGLETDTLLVPVATNFAIPGMPAV